VIAIVIVVQNIRTSKAFKCPRMIIDILVIKFQAVFHLSVSVRLLRIITMTDTDSEIFCLI